MLHRLDDLLLDRVFQRVSDALSPWCSCYDVAAFLLTGGGVGALCCTVSRHNWASALLCLMWLPRLLWRAYRLAAAPPTDALPPERVTLFWVRVAGVILMPCDLLRVLLPLGLTGRLEGAAWVLVWLAVYFMSCRSRPPAWRPADRRAGTAPPLPQGA